MARQLQEAVLLQTSCARKSIWFIAKPGTLGTTRQRYTRHDILSQPPSFLLSLPFQNFLVRLIAYTISFLTSCCNSIFPYNGNHRWRARSGVPVPSSREDPPLPRYNQHHVHFSVFFSITLYVVPQCFNATRRCHFR